MHSHSKMPSRAPALFLLLGIVGGLCLAREMEAPVSAALGFAFVLALLSLVLSRNRSGLWMLSFLAACILTFWTYGSLRQPTKPEAAQLEVPIREAELSLVVKRVIQARSQFGHTTGIAHIIEASPTGPLQRGSPIFFRLELPKAHNFNLFRGSEFRATGVLIPIPDGVEADSFNAYLKDAGIHYRFERNNGLEYIRPPSRFDQFCQQMKTRFQNYLQLGAPEDRSLDNIYIAMLLGQKTELSDAQTDRFRMTGTMHFFAISGLHIGVIATVIAQFLILVRVPRRISPFIGLPLLYLYVEITGASPSAVRAFLMALFFWASFAFTRQRSPLAALAASAVFVLLIKPDQLSSIGFQLSYSVVLSILLLGLPLYETASAKWPPFRHLPKSNWTPSQHAYAWAQDALLLLFAISISAWLASSLLSAAFFGYFSPGAILLNMALVHLAALVISAGVISLSLGLIGLESMAAFINHAAWVTIQTMDSLVAWGTGFSGMIVHCEGFPKWIAYAGLAIYFALLFWLQPMPRTGRGYLWAMPPGIVLLSLFYGLAQM